MADTLNGKITRLSTQNIPGEKKGNISWVQCNFCSNWFHVTKELIDLETIYFHCPNCHKEFKTESAKKIIIA